MRHKDNRQSPPRSLRDDMARHLAVADELASDIAVGHKKPRTRLPGEHELARTFGVSRVTVRSALRLLEQKGLIFRRPGVGTFVAAPRLHHNLAAMESLFSQFVSQDVRAETKLLEYHPVAMLEELRQLLGQSEAMLLRRLWLVDGVPFALTRMYMHPAGKKTSFADAEKYPGYLILEKLLGYRIARAEVKLRAERAERGIAKLLELRAGDPVLILERTSFSSDNEPLEHTDCFIRSDAIEFRLLLQGSVSLGEGFQRPSKVMHLPGKPAA
jgi:GntR family transcriptional regulator